MHDSVPKSHNSPPSSTRTMCTEGLYLQSLSKLHHVNKDSDLVRSGSAVIDLGTLLLQLHFRRKSAAYSGQDGG